MVVVVLKALGQDPVLFSRLIETQIHALIVKPFNAVANDKTLSPILLSRPRLIILDGLDECRTTSFQTHILNALSTAVKDLCIPLCFLIASRPEHDIRQAFNDQTGLGSLSFCIALDDTYRPDDDIRVFLQSTFVEIKQKPSFKGTLPSVMAKFRRYPPVGKEILWAIYLCIHSRKLYQFPSPLAS